MYYTIGYKKDCMLIFKEITGEHIADLHCKCQFKCSCVKNYFQSQVSVPTWAARTACRFSHYKLCVSDSRIKNSVSCIVHIKQCEFETTIYLPFC